MKALLLVFLFTVCIFSTGGASDFPQLRSNAGRVGRKKQYHQNGAVEVPGIDTNTDTSLASFLELELLHGVLQHILKSAVSSAPEITRVEIADSISEFVENKLLTQREKWKNTLDKNQVSNNAFLEIAALQSAYPRATRSISPKCLLYQNYFFGQCAHGPPITKINDPGLGTPGT